jgi:hypothetical protein
VTTTTPSADGGSPAPPLLVETNRGRFSGAATVRQCGLGIPNLPPAKAENLASYTATRPRSADRTPVSGPGLPKTGIFQISAGDYRRFRSHSGRFWSPETASRFAKARHWRAFLSLLRAKSPVVGLAGWRRSADRTCLQPNSLQTGNFSGKSAVLELTETISTSRTPVPQRLFEYFPRQINREKQWRNRESFRRIRELKSKVSKRPFLAHFCCGS